MIQFIQKSRVILRTSCICYLPWKYQYLTTQKQTTLTPAAGGGKEEPSCIVVSPLGLVMNKILQPTACYIWRGGGRTLRGSHRLPAPCTLPPCWLCSPPLPPLAPTVMYCASHLHSSVFQWRAGCLLYYSVYYVYCKVCFLWNVTCCVHVACIVYSSGVDRLLCALCVCVCVCVCDDA